MKKSHQVCAALAALGLVAATGAVAHAQATYGTQHFTITKVDADAAGSFLAHKRCEVTESQMSLVTFALNNPLVRTFPVSHADPAKPNLPSHIGEFAGRAAGVPTPAFPSGVTLTNYWVGHGGEGLLLKSVQGGYTAVEDTSDEAKAIVALLDAVCP
jgi:hypothetical protein